MVFAADALVALASCAAGNADASSRQVPRVTMHVRIDHAALVRGHTAGEVCEIPGIGPIPVATARALIADSVLSVIVTKGVEVVGVAHGGRTVRANVRRAVEERSPSCDVAACPVRHGFEIDHVTGYAITRDTKLDGLARLCEWHQYLKTHHGYRISGPPEARQWHPPAERAERAPPAAA